MSPGESRNSGGMTSKESCIYLLNINQINKISNILQEIICEEIEAKSGLRRHRSGAVGCGYMYALLRYVNILLFRVQRGDDPESSAFNSGPSGFLPSKAGITWARRYLLLAGFQQFRYQVVWMNDY